MSARAGYLHQSPEKRRVFRMILAHYLPRVDGKREEGYVPPGVINWNDADDNNAFHAKLMVMDFDGTISTEVAIYDEKQDCDDIVTRGLPLGNEGKPLTNQIISFGPVIPKGAKKIALAKEFLKYAIQPKVLNEYLKGGLGRWMIPILEIAKSDPFWLKEDPHRTAYTELTCWVFNLQDPFTRRSAHPPDGNQMAAGTHSLRRQNALWASAPHCTRSSCTLKAASLKWSCIGRAETTPRCS